MTRPTTFTASRRARRRIVALALAGAMALVVAAFALLAPGAEAQQPPIHGEELTQRATFVDDFSVQLREKPDGRPRTVVNLHDASHMAVMRITIQPGAMFPWHTHPGPVTVAIDRGDFVFIYADDCVRREYAAGNGFFDPGGGSVHMAYNPSATETTVVYATFLGVPAAGPLTIPVDDQAGLDATCGIARPGS